MRLCSRVVGLFFLLSVLGGFGGGSGIFNPAANSIGDFQGIDSNKAAATGCSATFALDGSNTVNTTAAANVVALTTTNGCGVIVIGALSNAVVSNVTAPGLTFTSRASVNSGGNFVDEWTAPYTTNFSGNITVTYGSSTFTTVSAFGVSGAKTSSSFDSGGPQTSISAPPPITTTNANDFIYTVGFLSTANNGSAGSGWTLINGINFQASEFQIFTTTQTALTPTYTTGTVTTSITDAIKKGP